jgi:pimeloyl-ACP methyl ester carboxylesterase
VLGDPAVLEQLVDLSPPPEAQARQLLSLLFDDATGAALYPEVGQLVAAARAELDQDVLNRQREALEAWHRDGVVRRLGQLSLPVLVAAGTADRVLPPTNSLILAQAIADAWLLRFPGAGHAFMAQYPGPLSTVINQFLAL